MWTVIMSATDDVTLGKSEEVKRHEIYHRLAHAPMRLLLIERTD